MTIDPPGETTVLLTRLGAGLCAIPLSSVAESMRPLPIEPVPGAPPFLRGLAVIRGSPVPVVDLGLLIGTEEVAPGRYVLLRLGARNIALAVEGVVGVRRLDDLVLRALPPLLQNSDSELVSGIGVRDDRLVFLLRTARIVPDEVWRTIETGRAGER